MFTLMLTFAACASINDTIVLTDTASKAAVLTDVYTVNKPVDTSSVWDWLGYVIGIAAIIILKGISQWKALQYSSSPLIQRFIAETSTFLKRVQKQSLILTGILSGILLANQQGQFLAPITLSIINNLNVICLSISGLILFTSKNPEHQD